MANKINLNYEDDYEVSNSEDEYTEHQKKLLKKARKGKKQESDEEEIFGFDEESSEPEKFEAESDIEEQADDYDDYLPDERAWGKKKSSFYNTDFHDKDYRGYTEQEEEIANQEQAEALQIQKRLATELNDADFNLDMFALPETQPTVENDPKIKKTKTDLSDLSRKQKLALFKTEAPEFDQLTQDFDERFSESKEMLIPVLNLIKSFNLPTHPLFDFIECRNELNLNYCTNISFYLMLKAKRTKVHNHPVVKRLIQFRQLICQLDDIYEYVVKPQLVILTNEAENNDKREILENLKKRLDDTEVCEGGSEEGDEVVQPLFTHKYSSESEEEKEEENNMEVEAVKREITRQIAKNKGLTATKRKELRNPRVKNKMKFRKAVIRRKGAVREVKSKVDLYGGETSGVKTHLKRSIKLK
ncbi:CLUMA_CG020284, isoform A [Clunio marinus]|uniref:CLUMA_CG020284, isoform A n=1 Tax=Clunio marinus TaxID=568069 RepID=A0A1J1J4H9_9DIPT|nr:CLUMA_CG020284, isoform A [Clunio marinus]